MKNVKSVRVHLVHRLFNHGKLWNNMCGDLMLFHIFSQNGET